VAPRFFPAEKIVQLRWLVPLAAAPALHSAYAAVYLTPEQAQHAAFPAAILFNPGDGDSARPTLQVWEARDAASRLGWLLIDRVIGRTEQITYALALDTSGTVLSLEVLEYRETHGSEIRLLAWRKQFAGKQASTPPQFERDIRNIVGATLSCRHVTEGVAQLLAFYTQALAKR
jgi:hypothetical protein